MQRARILTASNDGTLTYFEISTVHTRVPSLTYAYRHIDATREQLRHRLSFIMGNLAFHRAPLGVALGRAALVSRRLAN